MNKTHNNLHVTTIMLRHIFRLKIQVFLTSLFGLLCCTGCSLTTNTYSKISSSEQRSVYYWKTHFDLSEYDIDFIHRHGIQRIYLHMFDIDYDTDIDGSQSVVPIATTRILSAPPTGVEIVPVIYITQSAIRMNENLSTKIYTRIQAMVKHHHLGPIHEIQLDCDWTGQTRSSFFSLCKDLCQLAHHDKIAVSSTIRLHQLREQAPPVDKGVLMVYNTGSIYNPETKNSILDINDVKPYVSSAVSYDLPLAWAFPAYSWGIWYRNKRFMSLLHHTDFTDTRLYTYQRPGHYQVRKCHELDDECLSKGDEIRYETSSCDEILKVKSLLSTHLSDSPSGIVIFHLDSVQLSSYTNSQISEIFQ